MKAEELVLPFYQCELLDIEKYKDTYFVWARIDGYPQVRPRHEICGCPYPAPIIRTECLYDSEVRTNEKGEKSYFYNVR